jgi:hypothetical protein
VAHRLNAHKWSLEETRARARRALENTQRLLKETEDVIKQSRDIRRSERDLQWERTKSVRTYDSLRNES